MAPAVRAAVVDHQDLVVLLQSRPLALTAGNNLRHEDPRLMLLVLVQPLVDQGQPEPLKHQMTSDTVGRMEGRDATHFIVIGRLSGNDIRLYSSWMDIFPLNIFWYLIEYKAIIFGKQRL